MRKNDDDEGRFCDPIEEDEFCSVCESSWIEPISPYMGDVSVAAIMQNLNNGHAIFPENMGNDKAHP